MKSLAALFLTLPLVAFGRTQSELALPPPVFADTEVSTNLAIDVSHENMGSLEVVLTANATSSNNVQIAFGVDADGDGALGSLEAEVVVGWDCGAWFVRDERAEWSRRWSRDAGRREFRVSLRIASRQARALDLSDGEELFSGRTPEIPLTLFNPRWNCLRVTSRGHALREEFVSVRTYRNAFVLQVR